MKIYLSKSSFDLTKRIFRMIRLTFFILLILTSAINAKEASSQVSKVSIKLKNTSIRKILTEIESQTGYLFAFSNNNIDVERKVTVDKRETGVDQLLDEIFNEENISYKLIGDNILLTKKESAFQEKEKRKITGTVKDMNGEPLPGVTITIVGTQGGVISDSDGKFEIADIKSTDKLVFSFIGMIPQIVEVKDQKKLKIKLKSKVEELEDVTVVAFGKQKKESIVGSISGVKPAELKVPTSNLTAALAGRISGVISYQTSGEPGKDNAQFFVRGITTFAQGASPLILIDGIEMTSTDLARLNTDDIESFSVLKDATSTAVYGARGANGIILVTTKKGREGKPQVSVRFENSISSNISMPELADPITYMEKYNEAVRTRRPTDVLPFSKEKIYNTRMGTNPNVFPSTDWQKELIKDITSNQRVNFNIRGGGKVAQYYVAASMSKDNGILKEDPRNNIDNNIDLKKYLVRSNISLNITATTKAEIKIHTTLDEFKGPAVPASTTFSQTLFTSPVRFPAVYDPDELNKNTPHILFGNTKIGNKDYYVNPYQQLVSGFSKTSRSMNLAQFELRQDLSAITKGLRMRFRGANTRTSKYGTTRNNVPFFHFINLYDYDPLKNSYVLTRLNEDGDRALVFKEGKKDVTNVLYGELAFHWDRKFGKHTANGMFVGIIRELSKSASGTLSNSLPNRNVGVSGRFSYDYDTKYFLEFNFGYNGSERFAKKNRFGFFPSIGGAWLISKENFFNSVPKNILSKVKLRASYGLVGNDAIGRSDARFFYRSEVKLGEPGYNFGIGSNSQNVKGVKIVNYANPNITWEVAKTLNLGLELNFMKDAIQFRGEYFTQDRDNILQERLTPVSFGLQAYNWDNVGKAYTEGIDLSIDGNKRFANGMWFSLRGTFTYSNGKFKYYEEPDYSKRGAGQRALTGSKIGQKIGYVAERLFIDDADVQNSPKQNFGGVTPMAGDIKYLDVNGDNEINHLDMVPIGNPTRPQITYGIGASLGYKNFDFSFFFQGNAKVSLFIDPDKTSPFVGRVRKEDQMPGLETGGKKFHAESQILKYFAENHWSESNQDIYALYPRLSDAVEKNNTQISTYWLRDASFIRLKQVELGYTFNKFPGVKSLRLYCSGTNLLTWSNFKLWDPEVGGNGFGYPLQRVFNLGLLVNF